MVFSQDGTTIALCDLIRQHLYLILLRKGYNKLFTKGQTDFLKFIFCHQGPSQLVVLLAFKAINLDLT